MIAITEKLLPGPVAIEKVTGERPSYSTYFRWTQRGIRLSGGRRTRLEFVKAGGSKRLTSVEAVHRFFAATTEAAAKTCPSFEMPPSPSADDDVIEAGLRREGL